jgi:hypothetical protein
MMMRNGDKQSREKRSRPDLASKVLRECSLGGVPAKVPEAVARISTNLVHLSRKSIQAHRTPSTRNRAVLGMVGDNRMVLDTVEYDKAVLGMHSKAVLRLVELRMVPVTARPLCTQVTLHLMVTSQVVALVTALDLILEGRTTVITFLSLLVVVGRQAMRIVKTVNIIKCLDTSQQAFHSTP